MNSRKQQIRQFILDTFVLGKNIPLCDDDSFLSSGLLDSMGILEIIGFLEAQYGVEFGENDLVPENLDSINRIEAFLERKLPAGTPVLQTTSSPQTAEAYTTANREV